MNPMSNILNKVIVREFYSAHASFFLVVVGIGAGFMRAPEHLALASFFVSSPLLIAIPIGLSGLYAVIIVRFNLSALEHDENEFLFNTSLCSAKEQWFWLSVTAAAEFFPAIVYGIFLFIVAGSYGAWLSQLLITLGLIVILWMVAFSLFRNLQIKRNENSRWGITLFLNRFISKPYSFFFLEWIVRREAFLFAGTKVFALLMLYGVSRLYKYDTYDIRLMAMGVLVAFSSQVNLIYHLHYFDNQTMPILRNLPLTFGNRFVNLFITMFLLLLPETTMVISIHPQQLAWFELYYLIGLGWSITFFVYGFLHWRSLAIDRLASFTFFMFMAVMLIILSRVPVSILAASMLISGLVIWNRWYYRFEIRQRSTLSDDDLSV